MSIATTESRTPPGASTHPLAGQQMMGAEMVVQVLADLGVDTIFGYSGGAILPTYDAIFRYNAKLADDDAKRINLIVPANEQGAGFMAAGYSRASGRVGVFLVTSGPGATNCVTPIRDCTADSIPVVLICGQVPRAAMGTDAFQEAPVFNIMSACAKHTFLVTKPEELEATIRSAFDIATSGRPGPVVIDLPKDVQNWVGTFQGEGLLEFRGFEKRRAQLEATRLTDEAAAEFFAMLAASQRPLLYCGGGIINADAAGALSEFARAFRIPVVTTLMGIGSMDTTDDLALHMLGMHGTAFANYAVEDCDFLIAAGSRFDDRVAGKVSEFAPNARNIAHLDIDAAEIGKVKNVSWSFVGDAKVGLSDLTAYGRRTGFAKDFSKWVEHIKALKRNHPLDYNRESPLIQPQEVIALLSRITKGEAIVTTGVGQHQMWAAQYFDFVNPRQWLTSGSMGTMGFGLPAAIGAKLACPDKTVICVDGDGSIRMNIGELETATTNGVAVKVLLLNNQGDGMVRQWQRLMFKERFSGTDKTMHMKDFVKAAEADGYGFAERVADRARLQETLERFVSYDGPAFLEVRIDPDAMVFPMVGPGAGYKEMMLGPYIKPREARDEKMGEVKADLF
ncbi:MAG: biosynthetic-type acetolactate synthase large subunit [Candidatus Sumerlaeia bacterium]|nr:biosynthetic-type acetolactate synthase large subunit [Candidatus Sumerlaeia bacterium]